MNETTANPSSKGRMLWNTLKGLTKIGFACTALLMMSKIYDRLDDIGTTAYLTHRKFDDVHELLVPREDKQEVVMTAAPVGSAGGVALCYSHVRFFDNFFAVNPDDRTRLECVLNDLALKPKNGINHVNDDRRKILTNMLSLLNDGWHITNHSATLAWATSGSPYNYHYFILEKK